MDVCKYDSVQFVWYPISHTGHFDNSYANLFEITSELYFTMRKKWNLSLDLAEFNYYVTAMLWCRLLYIRSKQRQALSKTEQNFMKKTIYLDLCVPDPINMYLNYIGTYTDLSESKLLVNVPKLPSVVAGERSGYHAAEVTSDTHNIFEEVPCLGVLGDVLMALASSETEPSVSHGIEIPKGSTFTDNLLGRTAVKNVPQCVKDRLIEFGITGDEFKEDIEGTRLNLSYLRFISDHLRHTRGFVSGKKIKMTTVYLTELPVVGNMIQLVKSLPTNFDETDKWTQRTVKLNLSKNHSMDVEGFYYLAYFAGFQLHKEPGAGDTLMKKHENWCCLTTDSNAQDDRWIIPQAWIDNRNDNRKLPCGHDTVRYEAEIKPQWWVVREILYKLRQ